MCVYVYLCCVEIFLLDLNYHTRTKRVKSYATKIFELS